MEIQQMILEKNVPCKMRDGVTLYADVYRPNAGTFPVLLTRLPYNKDLPFYSHRYLDTNRLVQNGYIVIIQDVRGRYNSEGDFYPFIHEAEDDMTPLMGGNSSIFEWKSRDVWIILLWIHPAISCYSAAPFKSNCTSHDVNRLANGFCRERWKIQSAVLSNVGIGICSTYAIKKKYQDPQEYEEMMKKMAAYYNEIEKWFTYMPASEWPPLKELGVGEFFFDFIQHRLSEEQYNKVSISDKFDRIDVPAYHIAGWYDNFLQATTRNFSELSKKENPKMQKLIIGPWAHGIFQASLGDRNFGIYASQDWIDYETDLTGLHIRWFNHWLKDEPSELEKEAPIKLFVMGINQWRDEYEWPLARTIYTPYYLRSDGKANTRFGDGKLNLEPPNQEKADTFIYDPKNPVPTNGGGTLIAGTRPGPIDQSGIKKEKMCWFICQSL